MESKKLLMQIGIGHACEYAYLIDRGCSCPADEFRLPDDMDGYAWDIAGVEMSPFFVENASLRYPYIQFHNYAVVEPGFPADTIEHQGWRLTDDGFPMQRGIWGWTGEWYETPTISLRRLFLEHGKPDALVLDVENYEVPILQEYAWFFHKPDYIKIEMHSRKSADVLVPLIMRQGYSLLRFDPVNSYNNTNTSDAQFLRSDIARKERTRYEYNKKD